MLERGVPLSAWRVARPVLVSGGLRRGRSRTVYVPAVVAAAWRRSEGTQRNEERLAKKSQIKLELLRRRALE